MNLLIIAWTLICIIIVGVIFLNLFYLRHTETQTITITDKGITVDAYITENGSGATSKYMIYTKSGEVFINRNSLWYRKWKSDELQGKLKVGKIYQIKTCGFRIPVLGMYKNILSATEIKKKTKSTKK